MENGFYPLQTTSIPEAQSESDDDQFEWIEGEDSSDDEGDREFSAKKFADKVEDLIKLGGAAPAPPAPHTASRKRNLGAVRFGSNCDCHGEERHSAKDLASCTAPTLQEASTGEVAPTQDKTNLVASSDDLPHAADDGRQATSELHVQENKGRPEPKRTDVRAKNSSEEDGKDGSENNQGHSLEESETQNNQCTVQTLNDLGISTDDLTNSLCRILGVSPDHPHVRRILEIGDTEADKKPKGKWIGRAWVNCMEIEDPEEDHILAADTEEYPEVEFEVALDSGSVVHVCASADSLGYALEESPGSRRGQQFVMGDGGKLGNLGQKVLKLGSEQCSDITSTFQIGNVTRPLMSVGKICDEGLTVEFAKTRAVVLDKNKKIICIFERQSGGLNVAKMKLRAPGFVRQ